MNWLNRRMLLGTAVGALVATQTMAQDVPAFAGLSSEEIARLQPLIEGARSEGHLSYWDTVIQPKTHDTLVAAFQTHYGLPDIEINYTLSGTGNLITRVEQEIAAKNFTVDIASIASPPWTLERVAAGEIMEYHSPEYANYQSVFDAGLGKDGYFAFNGGYIFVPMWNADTLDFSGTSYKDVVGAVDKGRLSYGDVGKSASYLATHIGQSQVLPKEVFVELAAMDPVFLLRSEQIASGLVSGEHHMAFSGMPTRAYQYNQKGANLKFMLPDEGVVLLPQNTFILAGAPHPNAAKLWIDFILSEQGQQILAESEALISGRANFESPLPEYSPSIESLKLIKVDWENLSTASLQEERKAWVEIFNP